MYSIWLVYSITLHHMNTELDIDPKAFLLFGLQHFQLEVLQVDGPMVYLAHGYTIEIEGPQLYKLSHEGLVVSPFKEVEELCHYISQDPVWNHG